MSIDDGRFDLDMADGMAAFLKHIALEAKANEVPGLLTLAATQQPLHNIRIHLPAEKFSGDDSCLRKPDTADIMLHFTSIFGSSGYSRWTWYRTQQECITEGITLLPVRRRSKAQSK